MAKPANIKGKTAQKTLPRYSKALRKKLGNNRPVEEIIGAVQLTKEAQEELIVKHDY